MNILDWQHRLRRTFYDLRTEGEGIGREAAALGLGVFIGCTPFYGFHLFLCWIVGRIAHLNRLKLYLAANISNPLFSPVLIFFELQTGAWIRRGTFHDISIETLRHTSPWTFGADILLGSVALGGTLGLLTAAATYATGGLRRRADPLALLWQRASDPYLESGITAWEFARGKLRGDPAYRALVEDDVLSSGGTVLDLGCGQGLALSVLIEAGHLYDEGRWPLRRPPPRVGSAIGVAVRPGVARSAQRALTGRATIETGDARTIALPASDAVLLFDVLHMLSHEEQDEILARVASVVSPGGVVLVREADAGAGRAFTMVRLGNRLKALVVGRWRQRFYFRTRTEWAALLASHGFDVTARAADSGTPFANLLLRGVRDGSRSPLHDGSDLHHGRSGSGPLVVLSAKP
jgi:SAM-dependent methyltransferase